MKIAFYNSYRVWGGGEKWHLEMATYARELGHSPVFFTPKDGELAARAQALDFEVVNIPGKKSDYYRPLFQFQLKRSFRSHRPQAIVFNSFVDVRSAARAARAANIPRRVLRVGTPIAPKEKSSYLRSFPALTHLVGISQECREAFLRDAPRLMKNINSETIIMNAIDLQKFAFSPLSVQKPFRLGNASRLTAQKGLEDLIIMAQYLESAGLDFEVHLAGEGEDREDLERRIHEKNLSARFHFLGHVEDVAEFLRSIHFLVFPSRFEGSARTVIEAMASGRPVVCYAASSMRELVEHEKTGLLAQPFNSEDFSRQVERLVREPEMAQKFTSPARQFAEENCQPEKNYQRWLEFLIS